MDDNKNNIKYASCVLVIKKIEDDRYTEYKFISVSLKDDHTDFNIPGGKVEKNEHMKTAAVRELKEETGIELEENNIMLLHSGPDLINGGYSVNTYYHILKNGDGEKYNINTCENHIIKWLPLIHLTKSKTWKEYNTEIFKKISFILKPSV